MDCPKCGGFLEMVEGRKKDTYKCVKCKRIFVREDFSKDSFMPYDHYNPITHFKLKQIKPKRREKRGLYTWYEQEEYY